MSTPDIRPETIALIKTMTGRTPNDLVAGDSVDLAWVDPLALDDLWTAAHTTEVWDGHRSSRFA
jgi:hypothetical protein